MKSGICLILVSFLSVPTFAANLPDRISCTRDGSPYNLVLVTQDPKLPEGISAIGLKKGSEVILKVAAHMFMEQGNVIGFSEIDKTSPKEVRLQISTKKALISNFEIADLPNDTSFTCSF